MFAHEAGLAERIKVVHYETSPTRRYAAAPRVARDLRLRRHLRLPRHPASRPPPDSAEGEAREQSLCAHRRSPSGSTGISLRWETVRRPEPDVLCAELRLDVVRMFQHVVHRAQRTRIDVRHFLAAATDSQTAPHGGKQGVESPLRYRSSLAPQDADERLRVAPVMGWSGSCVLYGRCMPPSGAISSHYWQLLHRNSRHTAGNREIASPDHQNSCRKFRVNSPGFHHFPPRGAIGVLAGHAGRDVRFAIPKPPQPNLLTRSNDHTPRQTRDHAIG